MSDESAFDMREPSGSDVSVLRRGLDAGGPLEPERYELHERPRSSTPLERREFLQIVTGLLVVVTTGGAGAQESSRGGRGPGGREETSELSAWLHIDEQGGITAYTGKVEIGQNIRTSLAQAIGDELHVPLDAITLIMGDTDLTPYDAGTFGSRTTPAMAPQLARAAATAREMLIDRAAAQWRVGRETLSAKDGRVIGPGGRSASYGELTQGQKLTGTVSADARVTPRDGWILRGKATKKVNGREMVTGRHQYTPDMVRPRMLYGAIVRPDAFDATLESVDDSAARRMGEVTVVRDADLLGVVAPNPRLATRAAAAIRARWRVPSDQPSSKTIFDYLKETPASKPIGWRRREPEVVGNVADARKRAARTFSTTYLIPYIAHVPLEPRAAVAEWNDGKLTVWVGTQRPFGVRSELSEAFSLPESRVRVIVPDMGSAYGGKHTAEHAVEAARLAKAAGRPVKLVWTRGEEFSWAYFRPAGVIEVASAVDADGRLVAWEFDNWNSGAAGIETPYEVPNRRIAFHPSESPLRQGSYRGLAATANHFAREIHMDEIARALGIDAVELRLKNLKDARMRAVLTAVAERVGWPREAGGERALGIACGTEKDSYVATAAEVSKTESGFRVERLVAAFECGAIVNPDGVRNQVEGSLVQGLGGALFEAIEFANGRILNGSLAKYRVPRFADMPALDVLLLDRPDLPSAGAGETPIVAVAPAIAAAARAFGRVGAALPVRLQA
jgi:CO/xanthine dehydrogenase Mo-binding subunit